MEIIYEQWAADQQEARYFEPPYDDEMSEPYVPGSDESDDDESESE